jgi:hypothetical protein
MKLHRVLSLLMVLTISDMAPAADVPQPRIDWVWRDFLT